MFFWRRMDLFILIVAGMKIQGIGFVVAAAAALAACGGKEAGAAAPDVAPEAVAAPEQPVHGAVALDPEMKPSEHFTGRVILSDELATGPGYLFVVVGRIGSPMPYLMKKYDVEGPEAVAGADGTRVVAFELTSADNFMDMPLPPAGIELKVRFDLDGYVETKGDSVLETQPVEPGARDLEITLDKAPVVEAGEGG